MTEPPHRAVKDVSGALATARQLIDAYNGDDPAALVAGVVNLRGRTTLVLAALCGMYIEYAIGDQSPAGWSIGEAVNIESGGAFGQPAAGPTPDTVEWVRGLLNLYTRGDIGGWVDRVRTLTPANAGPRIGCLVCVVGNAERVMPRGWAAAAAQRHARFN